MMSARQRSGARPVAQAHFDGSSPAPFVARVLVVCSDTKLRHHYRIEMAAAFSEVQCAEDPRDALAKAIPNPPALVIAEFDLAFFDGSVLCSLLRSDPITASVRAILVTTNSRWQIGRAERSGADVVLIKPFGQADLIRSVHSLLDESKPGEARRGPATADCVASGTGTRPLTRVHKRFETTTPPSTVPPLKCPRCDQTLLYTVSNIGGVSSRRAEQWDYLVCTLCSSRYQYRHRTRKLRLAM